MNKNKIAYEFFLELGGRASKDSKFQRIIIKNKQAEQ